MDRCSGSRALCRLTRHPIAGAPGAGTSLAPYLRRGMAGIRRALIDPNDGSEVYPRWSSSGIHACYTAFRDAVSAYRQRCAAFGRGASPEGRNQRQGRRPDPPSNNRRGDPGVAIGRVRPPHSDVFHSDSCAGRVPLRWRPATSTFSKTLPVAEWSERAGTITLAIVNGLLSSPGFRDAAAAAMGKVCRS